MTRVTVVVDFFLPLAKSFYFYTDGSELLCKQHSVSIVFD